ncbi:MAG: LUD domain-containing protein [Deltaproteobacteria bacterium]|jgi:iron-sulfur cluster protein|nr:LUD domain-containing protein [Deltaproteobacteria bacterium]
MDAGMKNYREQLKEALDDSFLRRTLDKFAVQYKINRAAVFADMNEREIIAQIADAKDASLNRLEELYARFVKEAEARGAKVHRARTAGEANKIVCQIAAENDVKSVIKSKSMTAEEIHLNRALEAGGVEVVETDLGEWIIQLRREGPTHMVMPAIHLSRHQVAEEFKKATGEEQDSDIGKLVKVARRELRARFARADMGVSGANFAVAESGTIGICTNEGNGRLTTTLPRVHVVVAGIDKLCPDIRDALRVISVLPRNATGQVITTYVSWISGATNCEAAADKKKAYHIVLVDNGRVDLLKDAKCREVLRCVRCGACANVCPVYRLVGGHKMGYVYIGAIGLILTYFFHGRDRAKNLVQNCIGCQACKDVCAAGIDLPGIILELRARLNEENGSPIASSLLSKVLANRGLFHTLLKFGKFAQAPVKSGRFVRHLPLVFSGTQRNISLPSISPRSFRGAWPEMAGSLSAGLKTVGIFAGCAQDFVYPDHLRAAVKLLARKGYKAVFPMGQSCCGLPLQMMGERKSAEKTAAGNVEAFRQTPVDHVLTLCASCASHIKENYAALAAPAGLRTQAEAFVGKIVDFSSLMKNVVRLEPGDFKNSGEMVAYHSPCHLCRGLGVIKEPRELIGFAGEYAPTPEEDVCCGFGGTYSVKFPEISGVLLERKLAGVEESGATTLVTDCPGCVMQLRGGEEKRGNKVKVMHLSEFLAQNLKS